MRTREHPWVVASVSAVLAAGTLATISATSQATAPAAVAACVVTPVISSDVAIGATTDLVGFVKVPVSFNVVGACTASQLKAAQWVGDTINTLGSVSFKYEPGNRPQMVTVGILDFGLYRVNGTENPRDPIPGLTAGKTTFTLRHGTSLIITNLLKDAKAGTTKIKLAASQYEPGATLPRVGGTAPAAWGPLSARVYFQLLQQGKWKTIKSAVLDSKGITIITVRSSTRDEPGRFIVPGTTAKMDKGNGYYYGGREPAIQTW